MNRQTLDKLRGLGFEFPESYDEVADLITASRQKEGENARISKIDILADSNNKKNIQIYTVRITLSTSFYHNDVFIKVNGIEYQAIRKDSLLGLNKYYATIIIDLETATTENGKLNVAAFLKKRDTNEITYRNAALIQLIDTPKEQDKKKEDISKLESKPVASITLQQLIAFGVSKMKATEYLDVLNKTFEDFKIDTDLKIIHFLAQIIHESNRFADLSETGKKDSDYKGFKGRGFMQLTGEKNYKAYEDYEGEDFTSTTANKDKLQKLPYSIRSAGWFWSINAKLNTSAEKDDFIYITKVINGGYNHYNDRIIPLKAGLKAFGKQFKEYQFKHSEAYEDKKASFGWGLWHDPLLDKVGFIKDKEKAIEGYKRYLALITKNSTPFNWYLIYRMVNFTNLRQKVDGEIRVYVLDVVNQQLEKLQKL